MSLLTLLMVACAGTPLLGCPVCGSETGEQVRAGLVDDSLGVSLAATVLPFVVLVAIVAGIHFAPRLSGRRGDR